MFQLNLAIYQGPLEVLLQLIERQELDITVVSLVQVTDQFLEYMHQVEQIETEALAEFVSIGARLIYIKSAALLARPVETEQEEDDGELLAQMLIEYRRFREAAANLREIEVQGRQTYPRVAAPPAVPPPHGLDSITMDKLLGLFRAAINRRTEEPEPTVVERQEFTVEEKMDLLISALKSARQVRFSSLIADITNRVEVVITLLALLELLKVGRIVAQQEMLFGDIVVFPSEPRRRQRRRQPMPAHLPASPLVTSLDPE